MTDQEIITHKQLVDSFIREEMDLLVQVKRFMECLRGDAQFRKEFEEGKSTASIQSRLERIGLHFELGEMGALRKGKTTETLMGCFANREAWEDPSLLEEEFQEAPLLQLWLRWSRAHYRRYKGCNDCLEPVSKHPRFNAWRERRIAACKSELGHFGNSIDHPLFSFELSKGCSVGCWFCAFSAEKLSAVFEYTPENRALWRSIAGVGLDLFGGHAGYALCYYATEPSDNPNYLDFIRDYADITGARTCTATAVPLKDPDWFRSLIAFYREETLPWPRISVLSTSVLRKIHDTYTPEELRDVELLMQMRDSMNPKARSGRTLDWGPEKLGGIPRAPYKGIEYVQGSISCLSGFIVNMVERTIKLVSPCRATRRWPDGCRVFAEDTFTDAETYRAAIEGMIEKQMPGNVTVDRRLAFRDDLTHEPRSDGFSLISPNQRHHITGQSFLTPLGSLIVRGDRTFGQIYDLFVKQGVPPLTVSLTVKDLFDKGLLDETAL